MSSKDADQMANSVDPDVDPDQDLCAQRKNQISLGIRSI